MLASIIIPVGQYHRDIARRAIASAEAQTLPCAVIPVEDTAQRGAGWARNVGAAQADTPFLVFLDADDELHPAFVERCITAYQRGSYVYTDWMRDGSPVPTLDCVTWRYGTWHPVTTLFPAKIFHAVGGFDETLPAIEDTDFYLKVTALGVCGVRVPEPLFTYTGDGQRSEQFQRDPRKTNILRMVTARYRDAMCSCSQGTAPTVVNEQQVGDVLATAMYAPATQRGVASGRWYPRTAFQGQDVWVDPRDAAAAPNLWRVKYNPEDDAPDPDAVRAMALEALRATG